MKLNKPIVVSPDSGGIERARQFANILATDTIALKKSRDRNTGEVYINEKLDYNIFGRDVILVDGHDKEAVAVLSRPVKS